MIEKVKTRTTVIIYQQIMEQKQIINFRAGKKFTSMTQ